MALQGVDIAEFHVDLQKIHSDTIGQPLVHVQ